MLKILRNSSKRSNPNRRSILLETGNIELEKRGRCIPIPSNLQSTKKKRLYTDFTDSPAVVPCENPSFIERECKKVCISPLTDSRSRSMDFAVEDSVMEAMMEAKKLELVQLMTIRVMKMMQNMSRWKMNKMISIFPISS